MFFYVYIKTVFTGYRADAGVNFFNFKTSALVYTENYVFGSGENVHQFEMLVNHSYFIFESVLGRIDENLLAVDENFAFVGSVYSADDVHKRSFSATVLS